MSNIFQQTSFLSKEEERALFQDLKSQETTKARKTYIKNKITTAHFSLVLKIAKQQVNTNINQDDFISAGMEGLTIAINKYDPDHEKNARFSTYAQNWIKAKIYDEAIESPHLIKLPKDTLSKFVFFHHRKASQNIDKNDPRPQEEKVLENLLKLWLLHNKEKGKSAGNVDTIVNRMKQIYQIVSQHTLRLDRPAINHEHANSFLDLLADNNMKNPEQELLKKTHENYKEKFLETAQKYFQKNDQEREWDILKNRNLVKDTKDVATLKTLSEKYNISGERVRQLETKAKNSLEKIHKKFSISATEKETPSTTSPSYSAKPPSPDHP